MKKPTLATVLFRHLWRKMQTGAREFKIENTDLQFGVTAYSLSKAVRRFISAEQILDKRPEELFQ